MDNDIYKNIHSFETIYGLKSIAFTEVNLMKLPMHINVLIIGAFKNSYRPYPNTVMEALYNIGIDVDKLSRNPEIDMRKSNGVWLSKEIKSNNISRIVCVEVKKWDENINEDDLRKRFSAIFTVLAAAHYADIDISKVSMPLLGTGKLKIKPIDMVGILLQECRKGLENIQGLEQVIISVIDKEKSAILSEAMDEYLGRTNIELSYIPTDPYIKRKVDLVIHDLKVIWDLRFKNHIKSDHGGRTTIIFEIIDILENIEIHKGFEFEILCRRLLEVMLNDISDFKEYKLNKSAGNLFNNIDKIGKDLKFARWIISYMHLMRILGNTAAHNIEDEENDPSHPQTDDLLVLLHCLAVLVPYWKNMILKEL